MIFQRAQTPQFACLCLLMLGAVLAAALPGAARACDATNPEVHSSGNLVWCADPTFWAAHSADVTPFFPYADALLSRIQSDFAFNSNQVFTIVVNAPNGSASTPTPYGPGINITGDAFYNTDYNVKGFYGYLLMTHEFINQWTELANNGGGWPTDWWANHRSPFPNAMDPIIMAELDQTAAAAAQAARFVPGGDSADPQVPLFTDIFTTYGGWPMLQSFFALLRGDHVQWGNLRDPPHFSTQTTFVSGNPSPLLANFIVAYMNLATGQDVQARFDAAGIGAQPSNWPSGTAFTPYHLDANSIAGIAQSHCRLAEAGADATGLQAASSALQKGDFQTVLTTLPPLSPCSAACSGVCACDSVSQVCQPRYLAHVEVAPGEPTTGPSSGAAPVSAEPVLTEPPASTTVAAGCACQNTVGMSWPGCLMVGASRRWRRRRTLKKSRAFKR